MLLFYLYIFFLSIFFAYSFTFIGTGAHSHTQTHAHALEKRKLEQKSSSRTNCPATLWRATDAMNFMATSISPVHFSSREWLLFWGVRFTSRVWQHLELGIVCWSMLVCLFLRGNPVYKRVSTTEMVAEASDWRKKNNAESIFRLVRCFQSESCSMSMLYMSTRATDKFCHATGVSVAAAMVVVGGGDYVDGDDCCSNKRNVK